MKFSQNPQNYSMKVATKKRKKEQEDEKEVNIQNCNT